MKLKLSVVFLLCCVGSSRTSERSEKARVAVIGGGIGGSTAAYFLREELGDDAEILLYEKDRIGGRVATVKVGDRFYESGGSVLHPKNEHIANLTSTLGLNRSKDFPIPLTFGLYDGQDIVFQTHRYPFLSSFLNKLRFLWRYGFDLLNLDPWIDSLLKWYGKIYPAQRRKETYATVYELFHSKSALFDDLVSSTIDDYMTHLGFGDSFRKELARIAMRTNYGQDLDIQAFVGAISLAGAQGGLWSVEGGNFRVAEAALQESKAQWKRNRVTRLAESKSGTGRRFLLTSVDSSGTKADEEFDAVVLAVPCTVAGCGGIEFDVEGIAANLVKFPSTYHRTVANFVKGKLDTRFFGSSDRHNFPDTLYSISEDPLIFMSIARKVPVDYGLNPNDPEKVSDLDVYKIFTPEPLTVHHVNRLFRSHSEFVVVDWMAYPNYDKIAVDVEASLPSFVLDSEGALISVNAIEAAASAIEQSIIGAKNAALLVAKYLGNR